MEELFAVIDKLYPRYLGVWEDICNIESPTESKKKVDAVGRYLIDIAESLGLEIEVCPQEKAGDAICITLNPESDSLAVVFSGHIDTVHPEGLFGYPPTKTDEENIYGPGVLDCKGGVVASLFSIEALHKCGFPARPVKLILQTDEENGSRSSGKKTIEFMKEKSSGAAAFLNTECIQGDTAVLQRKGILRYEFVVTGKATHSAKCFQGANAILEAAHKIIELEKIKDPDKVTCNCGVIEGGTVANSVAAECRFTADIRFSTPEELTKIKAKLQEVAENNTVEGCSCTATEISYRPAMPLCDKNRGLLARLNTIYENCGMPTLTPRPCLSGSDAAYITELGVPCIDSIGVDGKGLHSINEHATKISLKQAAKRLSIAAMYL